MEQAETKIRAAAEAVRLDVVGREAELESVENEHKELDQKVKTQSKEVIRLQAELTPLSQELARIRSEIDAISDPVLRQHLEQTVLRPAEARYAAKFQQYTDAKLQLDQMKVALQNLADNIARLKEALRLKKQQAAILAKAATDMATELSGLTESLRGAKAEEVIKKLTKAGKAAVDIGSRLADIISIPIDYISFTNAASEYETALNKMREDTETANRYMKEYKAAFDKWKDTPVKREKSPQIRNVTLSTVPGGIPNVSFYEVGNYTTKDPEMPNAEGDPWLHVSFIGGDKNCWDNQFDPALRRTFNTSGGANGRLQIGLFLYGNLGRSDITAQIDGTTTAGMKASITSKGKTKEELQEILNQMARDREEEVQKFEADMKVFADILAGVTLVLTIAALGLVVCKFAALALIIGLVGLFVGVVAVIALACGYIYSLFADTDYPIESSIKDLFPSGEPG
ncbi:MAG: hypothetical protein H0W78_10795 [Planctomycetes bacterium]|nr:hypothetical protein [Planctomycetota bacterium]